MTTAANWVANGASLEDCHSNIFSLPAGAPARGATRGSSGRRIGREEDARTEAQITDGDCPRHCRQSAALQSCIDGSKFECLIGCFQSLTLVTLDGGVALTKLHHSKASSAISRA
ncbi:mediator of RNA polymerase II transcription subunit 13-like isoform X1 [Tachysurus ichikawai]